MYVIHIHIGNPTQSSPAFFACFARNARRASRLSPGDIRVLVTQERVTFGRGRVLTAPCYSEGYSAAGKKRCCIRPRAVVVGAHSTAEHETRRSYCLLGAMGTPGRSVSGAAQHRQPLGCRRRADNRADSRATCGVGERGAHGRRGVPSEACAWQCKWLGGGSWTRGSVRPLRRLPAHGRPASAGPRASARASSNYVFWASVFWVYRCAESRGGLQPRVEDGARARALATTARSRTRTLLEEKFYHSRWVVYLQPCTSLINQSSVVL
jgi:hypothetical protein